MTPSLLQAFKPDRAHFCRAMGRVVARLSDGRDSKGKGDSEELPRKSGQPAKHCNTLLFDVFVEGFLS